MIFVIVLGCAIAIGVIMSLVNIVRKCCGDSWIDLTDIIATPILIIVLGAMVAFVAMVFTEVISDGSEKEVISSQKSELVAISEGATPYDSVYLHTQHKNNGILEYKYVENTEKGKVLISIDANDTYVRNLETDEAPYLVISNLKPKNKMLSYLSGADYKEYCFYIPRGSIIEELETD